MVILPALDRHRLQPLLDGRDLLIERHYWLRAERLVHVVLRVQLIDFAVGFHLVHDISVSILVRVDAVNLCVLAAPLFEDVLLVVHFNELRQTVFDFESDLIFELFEVGRRRRDLGSFSRI